ncbi:AAA family ATPase [Francisella philomiragia]|uniref:Kinase-like protein n=1 Tax=Francisella philomiragia subsp. philomiragia (strain ATCC 25017 / CCUG 19701 / FSC 153 / O\|nr:AAA family ATPase [Francisella philomiragia]AJI46886.1 ATPase associated with various cellular activities family protein [Francisella philomiragia]AJI49134.1 ATPase associated with various cellular activities family protein [Francisella philomiragia]MBK2020000.1 AAA family ATPase [Francisella philomiragia]MBK2031183.1 AAA family ATPase [Francisella philomiragia]MBK2263558.1 AAA family ATPase [Francisella philomiragia]
MPNAYIFSGLPGVGKTTLAKQLAQTLTNVAYFRVDTVEYYLKKAYLQELNKQGYEIVYYQAKENLELGKSVIIDCCNPILGSRELWNSLSLINNTKVINIEIICSDIQAHQNRIETRYKLNPNKYPTWQDVVNRDYQVWNESIIKIDTAETDIIESFNILINQLEEY